MMNKLLKLIGGLVLAAGLAACGGGGGSAGTTVPSSGSGTSSGGTDTSTSVTNIASIVLSRSGSNTSIPADGSTQATVIVQALNSGSAAISGTTLTLSVTGGGVLSAGQVVTDSNGRATVNVTANANDQTSRNLVIAASCTGCTASSSSFSVPVQGASLTLNPATSVSVMVGGTPAELLVTVRGADSNLLTSGSVSVVSNSPGVALLSSTVGGSGSSNVSVAVNGGLARLYVRGIASGTTTLSVSAFGTVISLPVTVSSDDAGLAFVAPSANAIVTIGQTRLVQVSAPNAATVTLATSKGLLGNGQASQAIVVSGGVATFTISSNDSGVASLTAIDNLGRSASLSLVFSPASASKIILTAPQTSVPKAAGSSEPRVVLSARALYQVNGVDQPVAGVTVAFRLGAGPAGGERLEPALAVTNSSGVATTSFIAGTEATNTPIQIDAVIPDTGIATGISPSSNPILMSIGGGALSVAFGPSTKVSSTSSDTLYVLPYSVIVTDSSNNPVANKAVTLSMRPFAFSTGPACVVSQTYCSEDLNANGSLDSGEDGHRISLSNDASSLTAGMCPALSSVAGDRNTLLTPQNSDAGSVPSTVTTDSNGVATFNLTYLKQSGLWVIPILKATVESNGTESSSSTIFRLRVSEEDLTEDGKCYLPDSPYRY